MDQKLKKIMILSGTYIVLMTVLLIGVSTAKYTESTVAYSSFGTAGFNVILLGRDETTGAFSEDAVHQFGKTLLANDLMPGMKYTGVSGTSTAKVFPFKVANGTDESNASDIALDYTVKLRTTRNIPLAYKLLLGTTVYQASDPVALDKDGNPVAEGTPQLDANGIAWYEWTFKEIGNTETGTVEINASPVFSLSGGHVDSNTHSLVVEWPVTVDEDGNTTNSEQYMKEIELLEVRIQAAQRNHTTQNPDEITVLEAREYSKGFIVLDPEKAIQMYEVDYRAFAQDTSLSGSGSCLHYDFIVDNGQSLGMVHPLSEVHYKISVSSPILWQGEESSTGSMDHQFTLWKEDRTAEEPYGTGDYTGFAPFREFVYKLNEEGAGQEVTQQFTDRDETLLEDITVCSREGSDSEYTRTTEFSDVFSLENTVYDSENETTVSVSRSDNFRLEIRAANLTIPAYLQLNGKLKIIIETVH